MALTATATPAIQDQLLMTLLRNHISKTSTVNKSFHAIYVELTIAKLPKTGLLIVKSVASRVIL